MKFFRGSLVLLELQSTVDRTMAMRILAYTALLYQDLLRTSSAPLPPVLPIVLYHGRERWTAPEEVAGSYVAPGEFLAPYQPPRRYFLLNIGGYTDSSLTAGRNLVAALIRLEHSRSQEDVDAALDALDEWLSESGNGGLGRAIGEWNVAGVCAGAVHGGDVAGGGEPEGGKDHVEGEGEGVDDAVAGGRPGGGSSGRLDKADGADAPAGARKFGSTTADRLVERLERIHDPEQVVEIGEELLGRLEHVCASSPGGDDPASL